MIDRSTIELIMDTAKIEDVVSDFVALRRRGVNHLGLCPFHNEKTPSFTVSPAKNLWKCFGCGKGGKPVHFIMEHEQLSYYDALRWLAKKYNIEIKERELSDEEKNAENLRESLFIVNQFANEHFIDNLHHHSEGESIGLGYLRHRGIRDEIIKKFQIGYSLLQRDALAVKAKKDGYNSELLIKTGLCFTTDDGKMLDRFCGRILFPVHTLSGKVIAFGGRLLQNNPKAGKYVNSPESEIYHKSDHLYGLYFAKQAIMQCDNCILVEGYLDVISMYQSGIRNVVASSGTALTAGQIKLIHRFTNNITLLYDGDNAGIKASLRGTDMLLEEGMNVKVVLLPTGEDPDSFCQSHSSEDVENYIANNRVDFIRFKTSLLLSEIGDDPIKRAGLIGDVVKSIAVVPNEILRSEYIKKCCDILNVGERLLVSETAKLRAKNLSEQAKKRSESNNNKTDGENGGILIDEGFEKRILSNYEHNPIHNKEREIIQFVLRQGEKSIQLPQHYNLNEKYTVISFLNHSLESDGIEFSNPTYKRIFEEAVEHINDNSFFAERYFMAHPNSEISRLAADLCSDRYVLSNFFMQNSTGEERNEALILFEQSVRLAIGYKLALVENMMQDTQKKMKSPEITGDGNAIMQEMQKFKFLKEAQQALNNQLTDLGFGTCALNV